MTSLAKYTLCYRDTELKEFQHSKAAENGESKRNLIPTRLLECFFAPFAHDIIKKDAIGETLRNNLPDQSTRNLGEASPDVTYRVDFRKAARYPNDS